MFLWHIYVTSTNKTCVGLAEQIVVKGKSLCNLSVFVSVARKHFTRLVRINQLCSSEYWLLWMCLYSCLYFPACQSHLFCATLYCHLWCVWLCHIFQHYLL